MDDSMVPRSSVFTPKERAISHLPRTHTTAHSGTRTVATLMAALLMGALLLGSLSLSLSLAQTAGASTLPPAGPALTGGDVSWPQCPKGLGIPTRRGFGLPAPLATATFVVLGLTNGPGFYPNPCLASQVAWVKSRHLWAGAYSVTTYPTNAQLVLYGGTGTLAIRLRRVGVAQARFNVATMRRLGLQPPMVWVDVEPYPVSPWSKSTANNNAVIDGAIAGYQSAGLRAGIYSYAGGWKLITGGRALPTLPLWVPVGTMGRAEATARCAVQGFTGGPTWITQWTDHVRDFDLTCPSVSGTAARGSVLTAYLGVRLAQGSTGSPVAALQRRLGGLTADGLFGALTKAKVVAFQRTTLLPANGDVAAAVWRALGAGVAYTPARPSRIGSMFGST